MSWIYYNPNKNSYYDDKGDCVIRAISKVLDQTWETTYWDLCDVGFSMGDWGNSNKVWDSYLRSKGYSRYIIPNTCPDCYTVEDFCHDHPYGIFVLATGNHTVAVESGDYYDSWDSGRERPIYYYKRN